MNNFHLINNEFDSSQAFYQASQRGVMPARVFIECGVPTDNNTWPEPNLDHENDEYTNNGGLLHEPDLYQDVLTQFVSSLCKSAQFAEDTAYLHGLACVASAMGHNFKYNYYGTSKPVNLYAITSQPPSSGKSMINSYLSGPIREAFDRKREENAKKRLPIEMKLKELEKQLSSSTTANETEGILIDIDKLNKELSSLPLVSHSVTNATPEGLESFAKKQNGFFSVVSDESNGINTLMGRAYGDGSSLSNVDILLQGWDGDYMSVERVGRQGYSGMVSGSIAVIAQDETINTILQAGLRGNGISERFLLLKEETKLGRRRFSNYTPVDKELVAAYNRLIENIVTSKNTELSINDKAMDLMIMAKELNEPGLADNGKFSHPMLRGAFGKMDKQLMKIASILHVIDNWCTDGHRNETINAETMERAIVLFNGLSQTYIHAIDDQGFVGNKTTLSIIEQFFRKKIEKKPTLKFNGALTFREFQQSMKGHASFKGVPKLAQHLKDEVLPECEKNGLCVFHDKKIYINPKLG